MRWLKLNSAVSARKTTRTLALLTGAVALTLAGCGTSQTLDVSAIKGVTGHSVPGAAGNTLADQDRIDEHVARMCGAGVYSRTQCQAHTIVSARRRQELRAPPAHVNGAGV